MISDAVLQIIESIGEDPKRAGLLETPSRAEKAWKEWTSGYGKDPKQILKAFEDGAENYDEIVLVKDCPVFSTCEHHLAQFFGVAHVGYIPSRKIVGLSKIPRLVDAFSRRLQVQERITTQIADALQEELQPIGVAVILVCRHLCMESRGIKAVGSTTTTSAMRGVFDYDAPARSEFLRLVGM